MAKEMHCSLMVHDALRIMLHKRTPELLAAQGVLSISSNGPDYEW
jgi:hypothetical protein